MAQTTQTPPTPAALATNIWEAQRRASKAIKLIAAIDGVLPHIYARTPEMALNAVLGMGEVGWASAASVAGVNLPSLETREIVLDCFRRRVRASVDTQIAQSIAASLRASVG